MNNAPMERSFRATVDPKTFCDLDRELRPVANSPRAAPTGWMSLLRARAEQ
jgi:hypothetical protein